MNTRTTEGTKRRALGRTGLPAAVFLAGIQLGCGGSPTPEPSTRAASHEMDAHEHHTVAPAPETLPGGSVYHLDSSWRTSAGDTVALRDLGGRFQVIAMVYLSCTYSCPRIVGEMKGIEARVPPELRDRVGFVLVSIDPERDTPERARIFQEGSGLDPDRWTLLTGTEEGARELAAVLGVRIRRVSDTDFAHSNVLTLLDPYGEVLHREGELSGAAAGILQRLDRVATSKR